MRQPVRPRSSFTTHFTRRSRFYTLFTLAIILLQLLAACSSEPSAPKEQTNTQAPTDAAKIAGETYGKLPLGFEANNGQTDAQVKFLARGRGYGLFLTTSELVLSLKPNKFGDNEGGAMGRKRPIQPNETSAVVKMQWRGAVQPPETSGLDELPGKSNYFIGNDSANWQTGISNYARVHYSGVYFGVDMVFYGNQHNLAYDFVIAPGADPRTIELSYAGVDRLELNNQGDLVLFVSGGQLVATAPVIYQEIGGNRQTVNGRYNLKEVDGQTIIGFAVDNYDTTRPLIIDPTLIYSTYLGGSGNDYGNGIALDQNGNAYVTGYTTSANFPVASAIQSTIRATTDSDVIVTKINSSGNAIIYSTYLGGNKDDYGSDIAVDSAGEAYIVGYTSANNFPTASPFQTINRGSYDAIVAKLNPAGNGLLFSTYLGGLDDDYGYNIALDTSNNAYVTGYTFSTNFPFSNPFQSNLNGNNTCDAFITKFNAVGNTLLYSTYFGGNGNDFGNAIAVDQNGNAYIIGTTLSTDLPLVNALQTSNRGGKGEGFVAKFNPTGKALVYSTYFGGSGDDYGFGIAVDSAGSAYITGATNSTNLPVAAALQANFAGGTYDAFFAKLNPTGNALVYSSYLGGSGEEIAYSIAVDSTGSAYVTGYTFSANFPIVNPLLSTLSGARDGFVTKISSSGNSLNYSTFLGGSSPDYDNDIALDSSGNAYITGVTNSTNFLTFNAIQSSYNGGTNGDAFITKISPTTPAATSSRITLLPTTIRLADTIGASPNSRLTATGTVPGNAPNASTVVIQAAGAKGIPTTANGIIGVLTNVGCTGGGNLRFWTGAIVPNAINLNVPSANFALNLSTGFTTTLDSSGRVFLGLASGQNISCGYAVDVVGYTTPATVTGGNGVTLLPATVRVADTIGTNPSSKLTATGVTPSAGPSSSTASIQVAGTNGIPANVSGIIGVLTNIGCTGGGNLRLWSGTTVPNSVNLNIPGANFALNLSTSFVAALDSNGKINLGLASGISISCGYAIDVVGYLSPTVTTGNLTLLPSTVRVADTISQPNPRLTATGPAPSNPPNASTIPVLVVSNSTGIPAGATGVVGVLTNVSCTGGSNLRLWSGNSVPNAINLNVPGANPALNLSTGFAASIDSSGVFKLGIGSGASVSCGYAIDAIAYLS